MDIEYDNQKIKKVAEDLRKLQTEYGIYAKKINQRIVELKAATNLEVISKIPGVRLHELYVDKKNIAFAINISGNMRMVFTPPKPYPLKPDEGIDLTQVTEICIQVLCGDYH